LTSGIYRYGMGAATTLDGQVAQVTGQQSYAGIGVLEGLGSMGFLSAHVAGSRDTDSSGWLARLGYDYSRDRFSFAIRSHLQSAGYQTIGDPAITESLKQRTLASAGVDLGSMGVVSLASATQTYIDDSRRDIIALSHAMPFGGGGIVSTAAAYSPGPLGNSALWLSFSYPFDYLDPSGRRLDTSVNSALDRTITDAFGQVRLPSSVRGLTDKSTLP
jgi:hypothetical protein